MTTPLKNMKVSAVLLSSFFLSAMLSNSAFGKSTCYGTTKHGKLINGVMLPASGKNFTNYSNRLRKMGRTYVHSSVKDIVVASYKQLEHTAPQAVFKYAETGFKHGGKFAPHKTHQNGLSVDFTTPVRNKQGKSVHLPTNEKTRFGYDIEFDTKGNYKLYHIDYEALAKHLVALHQQSSKRGIRIWRVIFDPKLQPYLFKTKHGNYLKQHITFTKKRSWVRHDDHYHVDFSVPCKKM